MARSGRWSWELRRAIGASGAGRARSATEIERAQIEWVFALTGGELGDAPWRVIAADGTAEEFPYWYEGPPEYDDARQQRTRRGAVYRTVVMDISYGLPPNVVTDADGSAWTRDGHFTSSGEAACPGQDDPAASLPCDLCEEDAAHGIIYIGDGWAEVVYEVEDPV